MFVSAVFFMTSFYYAARQGNRFNKIVKYLIGLGSLCSAIYVGHFIFSHAQSQNESSRFFVEAINFLPFVFQLSSLVSVIALILTFVIFFKKDALNKAQKISISVIFAIIFIYMMWHCISNSTT